jgi:hypothetical protein
MISVYDELAEKNRRDPRLTARNGARQDLGILLFSRKEDIAALWKAAAAAIDRAGAEDGEELRSAVEKLRQIFGERP